MLGLAVIVFLMRIIKIQVSTPKFLFLGQVFFGIIHVSPKIGSRDLILHLFSEIIGNCSPRYKYFSFDTYLTPRGRFKCSGRVLHFAKIDTSHCFKRELKK